MKPRYQVVMGSQSGHACCFEATVVDMHQPQRYYPNMYSQVCECLDLADAERIAAALNKEEAQS